MKGNLKSMEAERRRLWSSVRRLLRSFTLSITVLIAGYALSPTIGLLSKTTLPLFGLQFDTILFLIIGAFFVASLIGFIRAVLNFLQLYPGSFLHHIPELTIERPGTITRLLLNAIALLTILVLYWIFSPVLYLILGIGEQLAAILQLVIASIVVLFFWSVGSTIYRGLDKRLRIDERLDVHGLAVVRVRVLKVIIYLLITVATLVVAYALFPSILLGMHIPIPGTGLTMGTMYWIIAIATVTLSTFSLIRNLVGLFGLESEVLLKVFPAMSTYRTSLMKRLALNLIVVVAILISFFAISPYVTLIPNVGGYLNAAGRVVVGAISILFFWDLGRSLYVELEAAFKRLEEKGFANLPYG